MWKQIHNINKQRWKKNNWFFCCKKQLGDEITRPGYEVTQLGSYATWPEGGQLPRAFQLGSYATRPEYKIFQLQPIYNEWRRDSRQVANNLDY